MSKLPQIFIPGQQVKIIGIAFAEHSHTLGKVGVIDKFIKSRGIYQVRFPDGQTLEKFETNLQAVPHGTVYYTSPSYIIGRHFWRFVVLQSLYYGRVSEYQWATTQDGAYQPDKDWPTYDNNDGTYAGCPHGLRKIFDTHRNEIDAALYDREPAQSCLI